MKKRLFAIMLMAFAIVLAMSSCKKEKVTTQSDDTPSGDEIIKNAVTDIDGNTYDAVKLGNQVWMAENLRTTKYADGTPISLGSSTSTTTAYRYYPNNNSSNVSTYGYLYNWPAVMHNSTSSEANPSGVQGICPTGWHVPSDAEWTQLTDYVSSQSEYVCDNNNENIAKALASTTGWNSDDFNCVVGNNPSANNATGFSALPAGYYYETSVLLGECALFWSATWYSDYNPYYRFMHYLSSYVSRAYYSPSEFDDIESTYTNNANGFSVRCLRD